MGITFIGRVMRFAPGLALFALLAHADLNAREAATITAVEVQDRDNNVTRIILRGAEDAIYTAFMREEPPRLIIELPNLSFDGVDAPIMVNNGLVNDVTLGTFGDAQLGHSMARVSIGLARESEYEVVPEGDEIIVELRPVGGPDGETIAAVQPEIIHEVPAAPAADYADEVPAASAEIQAEMPEVVEPLTREPDVVAPEVMTPGLAEDEAVPAAVNESVEEKLDSASRITNVVVGGERLEVTANGPIDNVDSFMLDDPDRLVIDFWGAKSSVWPDRFGHEEGTVSRVRIGEHPDKVRVVLDLRSPLSAHQLVPNANGVMVQLESAMREASDYTSDASQAPAAATEDQVEAQESSENSAPEIVADTASETSSDLATETDIPETHTAETDIPETTMPETDMVEVEPTAPIATDETAEATTEAAPDYETVTETSPADATGNIPSEAPVVQSVHFESLPGVDRIVVTMTGDAAATIVEPDPATLIVMLPSALIGAENERRVDTSEFGGPVKMFSVFKTPDIDSDEVRVVLHRTDDTPAALEWEDGQLRIEMERDESAMPMPSTPTVDPTNASPTTGHATQPPAAPAQPIPAPPVAPAAYDPFLDGPANPAAIDILEEGGFDEEKGYEGRRISLDFKDADIANILRLIAEVSDLNVIAGEEVKGRVTIRLVDVPWDQALDVILLTKGLGFVRIGNILRIAPVQTLKLEREARLQERRAREKLEDLIVKLQPVNYAKAKDMSKLVKRLLSSRGSVNVDKRTNTLIIKDIPSVIHEATALVKAVDTQTPQVMIETKIVEASLNFSRGLGAIWGAGFNHLATDTTNGTTHLSQVGGEDFRLGNNASSFIPGLASQANNFISSNSIAAATGLLSLGVLSLDDHLQLDLQLAAQEENRKGKVISSPRVVTLDNKEATIKQGVAIKFTETTSEKITVSFIDAVLQLKVTPHITANRSIIMKVKVSRNAPALSAADGTIVGIEKNETKTEAIVRDGETMVLGGIYVVENGRSRTKVPFLADIPMLGAAFRSFQVQDERRELLVFVTPRIIQGPGSDL